MSNTIYVHENFCSEEPALMGRLYIEISRGAEHHSFEFEKEGGNTVVIKHLKNIY